MGLFLANHLSAQSSDPIFAFYFILQITSFFLKINFKGNKQQQQILD